MDRVGANRLRVGAVVQSEPVFSAMTNAIGWNKGQQPVTRLSESSTAIDTS